MSEVKAKMPREKALAILGGALLLVTLLAAYSNHFHNSFHFDDAHTILNNAAIRELRNIPLFFRDATTFSSLPSNQSYRPLVSTLLAIDYSLGHGLRPFWFHLSIFALFIALTLLLVFVIYRLIDNLWIAVGAAAVYGLHPSNADTVNYVIASSEVISTLGVIASFAVYFAFPQLRRHYLYVLLAATAVLAKPIAAIFPLLFAIYRLLFPPSHANLAGTSRRPQDLTWFVEVVPPLMVCAGVSLFVQWMTPPRWVSGPSSSHANLAGTSRRPQDLTWFVEVVPPLMVCAVVSLFVQWMTPTTWVSGSANAHNYLMTQPYVALLYFKTFFWPSGLSADYDLNPFTTTDAPRFWAGFAFVILFTMCAIAAAFCKKTRVIGFGLLWFLIALLPTALFPLAEVMNDHRTFLPYIGLVIAIAGAAALLVARLDRQPNWAKIVATCAVVLFLCANGYATFQRNKVWRTEETLWHDVVIKSPGNGRGLMNYGNTLMAKGDYAGALDYFPRAQHLTPQYSVLFINLAIAEDATKQSALAEQHFKQALRLP